MTVEEAKALVLREGLAGENTPEEAAFILLHFGNDLGKERMADLLRALNIICSGLQGETIMDRGLASALWTLGNSSNDCLFAHNKYGHQWRDGEMDEVLELIMAVEGVFYGVPSEGLRIKAKD